MPIMSPDGRNPDAPDADRRRGRGAQSNASGRFERLAREAFDDGWAGSGDQPALKTRVSVEKARRILTRNASPDIPFDRSINPYRGCEHGCIYCYARPTHANMGLSPGLDFESRLFVKPEAARLLQDELSRPGYTVRPIALGTNTDPYQPIEKDWMVTRSVLEVLERCNHPVTIVTKSYSVIRDLDILARMAKRDLAKVAISVTTLNHKLARRMEPRASTPSRRLDAIKLLAEEGIPTGVMVAPVIPALNDHEIESILKAARQAGAVEAGWVLLRLPLEIKGLFGEWLESEMPDRARRVMRMIADTRGGRVNESRFFKRQRGQGVFAELISKRFKLASERLGYNRAVAELDCSAFRPPAMKSQQTPDNRQLSLFG